MHRWVRYATFAALVTITSAATMAGTVNLGYVSFDVTQSGSTAAFDIVNLTGPNASAFPDTTFPVTTSVNLSDLSLMVHFTDGTTEDLGPSYFTLALDGLSFDGGVLAIGGTNPQPDGATLTGMFSPTTVTLNDGSSVSLTGTFNAAVIPTRASGLMDGDLALIAASTGTSTIPEPGTFALLLAPLGVLVIARRRWLQKAAALRWWTVFALCAALMVVPAFGIVPTVKLSVATSPDGGVAGVNTVNVTGQGFPSGTITPANIVVTFATSCGGTVAATTSASSIKTVVGTTKRVGVLIPGTLNTATYYVSLSDTTSGDAEFTSGTTCSAVKVTHTSTTLSACVPTSSLGVLVPSKPGTVTAYAPNGSWSNGTTGIQVVNIEGPTSAISVSTPSAVNSCSSNPATGESVCVANNTDVYLLTGTTLNTTLTSGSTGSTSFTGGSCQNCGVAINALNNKAVINMGLASAPSGSGIQMLDLATNTFEAPIPLQYQVSEDISIDPTRNLILSPNESSIYDLLQIQSNGSSVKEFANDQSSVTGNFDSAAEDCSTGIGLAAEEFTNNVFVVDLTQAKLTAGSPGTWTAPSTNFTMTTAYGFSAGTSGIAAASGTSHLAIVTGEFGGNTFAVLKLPSTSGSGTPTILDYAVAQVPSSTLAACAGFNAGTDPHTVTAYTSPNDGKAYGLMAGNSANCLVRLDLAAILAASRGGSGLDPNDVSAANFPAGAATFYSTH